MIIMGIWYATIWLGYDLFNQYLTTEPSDNFVFHYYKQCYITET